MCDVATIPGLAELWEQTRGDASVRVAVVDGPVDLEHPAFAGADVQLLDVAWPAADLDGPAARHGTHVASVLFGRHDGPVPGICPGCSGLILPAFSPGRKTSQLELARAIELAVEAGAHVINISGGQLSPSGEAEDVLDRAVRLCQERTTDASVITSRPRCHRCWRLGRWMTRDVRCP
jgi:subtilisin family serine protease